MVHLGSLQGYKFLLVLQQLLCCRLIVQWFTVSIHFKYFGFLGFNKHGSSYVSLVQFLILSHLFYSFMCCIIHTYRILTQCIISYIFNKSNNFNIYICIFLHFIQYFIKHFNHLFTYSTIVKSIDPLLLGFTICHILTTNTASFVPFLISPI